MRSFLILIFGCLTLSLSAQQSYQQLSEAAFEAIEMDSLQKAEKFLKAAMKLEPANPSNALLFSNLGWVQKQLGQPDEAIESYTCAINMIPTSIPMLLDRAALYTEMGNTTLARYDYSRVLEYDPNSKEALLMRAYLNTVRREYTLARADYVHLLAVDAQHYNGKLGLAMLAQKEGKYREAIEHVNEMMITYPEDATLYIARADIEREMNHPDLALIDLERAIELDPNAVNAYMLRGEIYLASGKKILAKNDFEKAISLGVPSSMLREQLKQCQ